MSLKPFTSYQKEFINRGQILSEQLSKKIVHALGKSDLKHTAKRHHIFSSSPGIGKTYTVRTTAKKLKVDLCEIQGVASMSGIVVSLACKAYENQGKKIFVWIDDCDSIFLDRASLSVMKGVLDEDRNILAWNKNITTQIQTYEKSDSAHDNLIAEALRFYQLPGNVGIEIPMDNISFIITSNMVLTPPNSKLNTARKMDEAAIRDRVVYTEYNLDANTSWGWNASTMLSSKGFGLNASQKHILLDWMYNNWSKLPATSLRTINELAADMLNYPESYPDHWESKLTLS